MGFGVHGLAFNISRFGVHGLVIKIKGSNVRV